MIKVIGVKYYFSIRVGGIIGVSAAHCQKATETMLRNGNKKMHRCCVYQNMYPYIGYIFVFLEGLCFLFSFHFTLFTVSRLVLSSESEGRKQVISNGESK